MSRFLVTGGKGFIGKNLTRFLQCRFDPGQITSVGREFDLREPARVKELFQGFGAFDYIIHLADVQGDARWSAQNAAAQFLANAKMSLNVLEAWQLWQAQARLICLSSLWAYPEAVVEAEDSAVVAAAAGSEQIDVAHAPACIAGIDAALRHRTATIVSLKSA